MAQLSLLPVKIRRVVPSSALGFDGKTLRWVARCDDGNDYAIKKMADSPTLSLPLSEWVCYAFWGECGLPVPDCAVLTSDVEPPAFGSRLVLGAIQLPKNPASPAPYTIAQYFGPHRSDVAKLYPADAFLPNRDRHGRNVIFRPQVTGTTMVSIDFSQAWLETGAPFGDMATLAGSNTEAWWRHFRDRMQISPDHSALDLLLALPDDWLRTTIGRAPAEWSAHIDLTAADDFWRNARHARGASAKMWL